MFPNRSCKSLTALGLGLVLAMMPVLTRAEDSGSSQKHSSQIYKTIDFPGTVTTCSINGLNNRGDYVGVYDDHLGNYHGFVGTKGKSALIPIDVPGATQTYLISINDQGDIVGTYFDSIGFQHGFRLRQGRYTTIDFPGAGNTMQFEFELGFGLGTSAYGLNNRGEIVGQYADENGVGHGFLLSEGRFTQIDNPDASQDPSDAGGTALYRINSHGHMVGSYSIHEECGCFDRHGFLLKEGHYTTIDPPGTIFTQSFGLNDHDVVSGFYLDASFIGHGFLFQDGKYSIVDAPGAVYLTTVTNINNEGDYVGEYVDGMGITHGYIATRRND